MYRSPSGKNAIRHSASGSPPLHWRINPSSRLLMKRNRVPPLPQPSTSSSSSAAWYAGFLGLVGLGILVAVTMLNYQTDSEVILLSSRTQQQDLDRQADIESPLNSTIKLVPTKTIDFNFDASGRLLSQLDDCLVKANSKHIRPHLVEWRDNNLPLFASLVQAPNRREQLASANASNTNLPHYWTATFSLCDITWKKRGSQQRRIKHVSDDQNWKCDGQDALVVEEGCPHGSTAVIQCPQVSNGNENIPISQITFRANESFVATYNIGDHAQCEIERQIPSNLPLKEKRIRQSTTIIGSVILYEISLTILLEWMEYHRKLGVDHFFLYVMQDVNINPVDNSTKPLDLPNLDYITYIPWNLNPQMISKWDKFLFQTAAQVDTLARARRLQHQDPTNGSWWIMYNDLDEFMVLKNRSEQSSLPRFLSGLDIDGHNITQQHDAVQIEAIGFGNKTKLPGRPKTHPPLDYHLNFTWRTVGTFKKQRCKALVQPSRIDYYAIHWPSWPIDNVYWANPWNELWIQHYKSPNRYGVFRKDLPGQNKSVIQDTSVRDLFAGPVQQRVQQILRLMDKG